MSRALLLLVCFVAVAFSGPVSPSKYFSAPSATYLAKLNAISYCPSSAISAWNCPFCDKSMLPPQVFVSSPTNLLSYITSNQADTIMVVFKGTDPLSWAAWWADLQFAQVSVPYCSGCKVHSGFLSAMTEQMATMDNALRQWKTRLPNAQVVVTGHSLGAAIAQLYAVHMIVDLKMPAPTLYSLGAPRVGNSIWASYMNSLYANTPLFHVISNADVVPHLPPNAFGFSHAGTVAWCQGTSCQVMPGAENDGGFLHVSITDHGSYMGTNYFDFISIGFRGGCSYSSLSALNTFDKMSVAMNNDSDKIAAKIDAEFKLLLQKRPDLIEKPEEAKDLFPLPL